MENNKKENKQSTKDMKKEQNYPKINIEQINEPDLELLFNLLEKMSIPVKK